MKKYLSVLCVILFAACASDEVFNESPRILTSEQCDSILARYLTTEDDLYCLSISQEEALREGISLEAYKKFYKLMDDVNKTLREAKEQGIPIYRVEPEKMLSPRSSGMINEYPDLLCSGKLFTNTSCLCEFQGSSSIYILLNCKAAVWSVGLRNLKTGERFVMSGSTNGNFNERVYSVSTGVWFTDWSWELVKLGGEEEVTYSFRGFNCLNIDGTLAGCVLKVVDYEPGSYTIQIENKESAYKKVEIYWGTWQIGSVELMANQSYVRSNCSYGDLYRVNIFSGWGTLIGDATFDLDRLWQFN